MKVFISWSGNESRSLAESLRHWLPRVLLSDVETFVSSQDIEKGQRGLSVIAASLESTDYGLILLTQSNQHAPWINFESGALGKSVGEARVSPLLVDLTQADVTGPLQQFQMTNLSDREDLWKLLGDINRLLERPVPESSMRVLFDDAWPEIETAIAIAQGGAGPAKTTRNSDDILEEILFRIRRLENASGSGRTRLGPTGLTRDIEGELVGQAFRAVHSEGKGEVRGGMKVGANGAVVTISAPSEATIDLEALQTLSDKNDVRIEIVEHGISIAPSER